MTDLNQQPKEMSRMQSFARNPFLIIQTELEKAMRNIHTFFDFSNFSTGELHNLKMAPSVNIVEDDNNFKIEAEMPGLGEEDVTVSMNNRTITICGEKKISSKNEGKNFRIQEIGYGCYEREIALPDDLDTVQAKATFKKGMLWVNIPKKEGAKKHSKELKIEKA